MPRLLSSQDAVPSDVAAAVHWQARGELRLAAGGPAEVWLHVRARTEAGLQCQRCLMPLHKELEVERSFRFVPDESEAERLDEDSDDDVLVLTHSLNLTELVEDELILALPIVPRHEVCPQPLPSASAEEEDASPRANPFAVLKSLRTPGAKR